MAQVNKYADRAAYVADKNRLSTKSAISYIESESATVYDGVNVLVGKSSASIGDLVVWDKTAGVVRFIKSATIAKAQLPATLVPLAVVYARQGDRLLIVSLDNATYNGSASVRWAAPYEVALAGFNLAAGGSFTIKIYTTNHTFTYAAGSTLADIAANIAANLPNYNKADYGGWTAAASGDAIIMTSNTYSAAYATIDAVSGCTIRRTPENANYQTTLTGSLIGGAAEYVRRNNRVNSSFAGCNPEKFLQYYSVNGVEKTGQKPGGAEVIRESAFTTQANPDLVAAYHTYRDYLFGEHMIQYPAAYGAVLRDGRANTGLVGPLRFTDIRGNSVACYPAVVAALDYGVAVDGAATGLEGGGWWLPSVNETYLLMHDRVLAASDKERDPVNRTLTRMGKATCYGSGYYPWTSCEYNSGNAFFYNGYAGIVSYNSKYYTYSVRPVSAL